jgi:hypothetical protein
MRFSKIFRFTLGSRILAVKINAWNQELHTHYGITNQIPNSNKVIPFWDFDEKAPINYIIGALKIVQQQFGLSDIFILQTYPKESYRAFCFDEFAFEDYIMILVSTRCIDWSYLKHTIMRGRAVIRVTEKDGTKNKLIKTLDGEESNDLFPTSIHHRAFLSAIYPEIPKPRIIPRPIKVRLSKYESFR